MSRVPHNRVPNRPSQPPRTRRKTQEVARPVATPRTTGEEHAYVPSAPRELPEARHPEAAQHAKVSREESERASEEPRETEAQGESGRTGRFAAGPRTGARPATKPTTPGRDKFEKKAQLGPVPNKLGASTLSGLKALVKTQQARPEAAAQQPKDAISLLKHAQERGVLFQEDGHREGHTEDHDDPELAAAVELCIQKCFGLRGILRIGPGKNDALDPIIVVVATHGFGKASLAGVPEKVNRFSTVVAIPFELLPLRREP